MLRYALFAFGASIAVGFSAPASAQSVIVSVPGQVYTEQSPQLVYSGVSRNALGERCYDPASDGPTNDEGYPLCAIYLDQAAGGEQYPTLDRGSLANTQVCPAGANCGPQVELTDVKPFYGSASAPVAPAPAPIVQVPIVQAPPPVIPAPPLPPVALPPAPALFAPVQVASGGLSGAGLAVGALGIAAVVGVIALAADGDNDNAIATGSTQ